MSEDLDPDLIHRAVFGKQVDAFMSSDIGKYMIARAMDQKEAAQDKFLRVDCQDAGEVQKIQNAILLADAIVGWLQDAVGDGVQALSLIEDRS